MLRTLMVLALLAAPLAGHADMTAVEDSIETSTAVVSVPASVGSSLIARSCRSCEYVTMTLAATTRFFVGRTEISQADYARLVADGKPHSLTLMYNRENRALTRVVLPAHARRSSRR